MADVTLTQVPWPAGTNVGAYPRRSEFTSPDGPPPGVPVAATNAVTANRSLTYALPDGEYWACAPNGWKWTYVSFLAEVEPLSDDQAIEDLNERLDELEASDVGDESRLDALEASDTALDSRLDAVEGDLNEIDVASATDRQRPRYRTAVGKVTWNDPDVVDLRADFDNIRAWETSTGYAMTGGSPYMTCAASPFTQADIGKIVIAKQSASTTDPLYMATILDVSGNTAQMSSNAPASTPGQRGQRGFDLSAPISSALAAVGADGFDARRVHLPGLFRAQQIVLPKGVDFDGAFWGSLIPTPGGIGDLAKRLKAGTWLQQLPGSQKDFLVLEKHIDGGASRNWGGNYGLSNLVLIGPEQNVIGTTWTTGSGFAAVAPDGDPLAMLDGFWLGHRGPVYSTGFPGDGFHFPDAGVPLFLEGMRPYFNGRYGVNIEVRSNPGSQGGNSPTTHVQNLSGDGNSEGLLRFSGFGTWASIIVTALKSEKADYFATAGSPGSPGAPTAGKLQESAILFDDCNDTPVVINGSTHISAAPGGSHTDAPGPHILIRSATDLRPRIIARAIGTRRISADELTNLANGVDLRDSVVNVDIPAGTAHFDWPPRNDQPGFDQRPGVEEIFPRNQSGPSTTLTLSSGSMRGCLFTCKQTATRSKIRVAAGTAAGATPTLVRVGVYTVAANGDLTLVASSVNNTAKLGGPASIAGFETFDLSSAYKFLAGRRYAITAVVVTAAAAPTTAAANGPSGAISAETPRLSFAYGGQTDLPASVTEATLAAGANSSLRLWAELLA